MIAHERHDVAPRSAYGVGSVVVARRRRSALVVARRVAAAAGEHDAADDRDHEQDRGDLERPEEVGEQAAGDALDVAAARRRSSAPALRRAAPVAHVVAGEEQDLGEHDHAERDRGRPLEADRVVERLLAVDAEQHDHEQEEHDDRAGVDDDLHRGEELRVLEQEEHRDR